MFVFLVGLKVLYRNKCFGKKILRNTQEKIIPSNLFRGEGCRWTPIKVQQSNGTPPPGNGNWWMRPIPINKRFFGYFKFWRKKNFIFFTLKSDRKCNCGFYPCFKIRKLLKGGGGVSKKLHWWEVCNKSS